MASVPFLSVPSLWGIHLETIQGPSFANSVINEHLLQAPNVNHFSEPFETNSDIFGLGSLGQNSHHQFPIDPPTSATNSKDSWVVNAKLEFGAIKMSEYTHGELVKFLLSRPTYLHMDFENVSSSWSVNIKLQVLDPRNVNFWNISKPKRTWKPPWPPPCINYRVSTTSYSILGVAIAAQNYNGNALSFLRTKETEKMNYNKAIECFLQAHGNQLTLLDTSVLFSNVLPFPKMSEVVPVKHWFSSMFVTDDAISPNFLISRKKTTKINSKVRGGSINLSKQCMN